MARSRNIKPALFKNEILGVIDPIYTLLFQGLWCLADREGRLEYRPLRIKAEIFPYRDLPDFNGYLTELERLEFICLYSVDNVEYIQVLKFTTHQNPHKTEKASVIPSMPENINENSELSSNGEITVKEPLNNGSATADSLLLIPDSLSDKRETKPLKKRFKKPTLEEVSNYCHTRSNKVDAERFINHYESNGWMVGRNKMKNWQAAVRTWEKNNVVSNSEKSNKRFQTGADILAEGCSGAFDP